MLLQVQFLTGVKAMVEIEEEDTVGNLKEKIAALENGPAPDEQQLLFGGKLLQNDDETLADLDIFGETCIMCVTTRPKPRTVTKRPAAAKAESSSTAASASAAAPTAASADHTVPNNAAAAPAAAAPAPASVSTGAAASAATTSGGDEGGVGKPATATTDGEEKVPVEEEMIPLSLKTLRGTHTLIEVPAHATFGHIKHKYIQPIEKFPAIQMRLIYMGQLTDDSKTPFDYNICDESFIHLVRRPNDSIKSEVITQNSLRANCMWCHKAGVQLKLRPQCRTCKNEGAMYKDRVIEIGKSKWSDLEELKGICYRCGANGKEVDLSMGFLCTGQEGDSDGPSCPSRNPTNRKMVHLYDGGDLVESLNQIFGYAHARGFEV